MPSCAHGLHSAFVPPDSTGFFLVANTEGIEDSRHAAWANGEVSEHEVDLGLHSKRSFKHIHIRVSKKSRDSTNLWRKEMREG